MWVGNRVGGWGGWVTHAERERERERGDRKEGGKR